MLRYLPIATTILLTSAYAGIFYYNLNSYYGIKKSDLQLSEVRSPEEPAAVQSVLAQMGCNSDTHCVCAYRKVLATSSRVERVLVAFEGDSWRLFLLARSAEISVFNSLRRFGLADEEIRKIREEGRQKFLDAVEICN